VEAQVEVRGEVEFVAHLWLPLPDVVVKQTGVISRKKSSDILLSTDPNQFAIAVSDRGPRSATLRRSVQTERFCEESLTLTLTSGSSTADRIRRANLQVRCA